MNYITLDDKRFKLLYPYSKLSEAAERLAGRMNNDLSDKEVIFIGILNGAFMFAADILKKISFNCKVTFMKLMSYEGTSSSGTIKELIGLNENLEGKTVVILEDIIDTGLTMESICRQLNAFKPREIIIATMFFKPRSLTRDISIDYVGIQIPDNFIVGYGLDYNGYGRNLKDVYVLDEKD